MYLVTGKSAGRRRWEAQRGVEILYSAMRYMVKAHYQQQFAVKVWAWDDPADETASYVLQELRDSCAEELRALRGRP